MKSRSRGVSIFGCVLVLAAPIPAQDWSAVNAMIESAQALRSKDTDTAGVRQRLAEALAWLDQHDGKRTVPEAVGPRFRCGQLAWDLDDDLGLRAWDGVIAYYTKGGTAVPTDPQELDYCQTARGCKATILEQKKNHAEAIALHRTIIADWEKAAVTTKAAVARAQLGQTLVLSDDAKQRLDGLRELERSVTTKAAQARAQLGQTLVLGGDAKERSTGLRELERADADLGRELPGSIELAGVKRMLASMLVDLGMELDERVLRCQGEALAIYREHPPKEEEMVGMLWEYANTLQRHLRMVEARQYAQQSFERATKFFLEGDWGTFWPRGFYSGILKAMGDEKLALELAGVNKDLAVKLMPAQHLDRMMAWNSYGHSLMQLKEWDKAIDAFEEGRKARDTSLTTPLALNNFAFLCDNLGQCLIERNRGKDAENAEKLLRAAVGNAKSTVVRAQIRGGLGMVLQRQGTQSKLADAAKEFDQSIPEVLRTGGGFRQPAFYLRRQALTLAALPPSESPRLVKCLEQMLDQADKAVGECYTLPGRPSYELATLADETAQQVLALADKAPKDKDRLEQRAFEVLESLRGIELRVTSLGARLARQRPDDRDKIEAKRRDAFQARADLAKLASLGEGTQKDVVDRALAKEQAEFAALLDLLKGVDKGALTKRLTIGEIAEALPKDAAAVAFRVVTVITPGTKNKGLEDKKQQLEAHLVTQAGGKGKFERVILTKSLDTIRAAVAKWCDAIDGGEKRDAGRDPGEKKGPDPAAELAKAVLDPLKLKLVGVKVLVVCLDDDLHKVPLELLPGAENLEIRYAVSLVDLVASPPPAPPAKMMFAIGGLDYFKRPGEQAAAAAASAAKPSEPPQPRPTGEDLRGALQTLLGGEAKLSDNPVPPLPDTESEAKTVTETFRTTFAKEGVFLMGTSVDRGTFMKNAEAASFLHCATHGYFLASRNAAQMTGRESAMRNFAPMSLCGLALSGYNVRDGHLGFITGEEIAGLDLSACQMAVMSACETFLGEKRPGHGLASLQGALHAAGVRNVITARWKVPDTATSELMKNFYVLLWTDKSRHPRDALKMARENLRAKGKPVSHWAGFVLTGDLKD